MMKRLHHITVGNPGKLIKPVLYTTLANLISIAPFALLAWAAKLLFEPFMFPGTSLAIGQLWLVCALLVLSVVLVYLSEIPAYRAQYHEAYRVAADGRAQLAEHLRKLPLGYLNRRDPGDLANMMMGDFTLVEHGISHLVPQMIGACLMPLVALVGLALLDWRLALALFVAMPLVMLLLAATSRLQRALGANHMRAKINAANRLQEYLNGIRVMKACNLTGQRFERLALSFRELMRHSLRIEGLLGPIVLIAVALMRSGLTVMVLLGVHFLLGGELDLLVLVVFLLVGTRLFDPLTVGLINYAEFRYHEQAGERIVELLNEPHMGGERQPPDSHTLVFDRVTFGYGKKTVLNDLSMTLEAGTLTALVGPSGSGKSTVLRLIARFYDPLSGRVTLGGEDLANMDPEALLGRIAMVFQDVYLFQDTIGNNIRFGREGATQADVIDAAKRARCHDFIMKLPQGYDTPVGEGGGTLSGGEKQRISIARALLKDAPIVLLDEATASLDPENEADIQQAISALITGRTVVVVAHRLKTIVGADQIVVLEDGHIVERGQHAQLLDDNGLYARLWHRQRESDGWKMDN